MFTLMKKAVDYLSGDTDDKFVERPLLEEFISPTEVLKIETNEFIGTVTVLTNSDGIINKDIYFQMNKSIASLELSVGSRVSGEAFRNSSQEAWQVQRLQHQDNIWDQIETQNVNTYKGELISCRDLSMGIPGMLKQDLFHTLAKKENLEKTKSLDENSVKNRNGSVTGIVTGVVADTVTLNDDLFFCLSKASCSFKLVVGDWISCNYLNNDKTSPSESHGLDVSSVVPLRKKIVQGEVTHAYQTHVIINHEIHCPVWLSEEPSYIGDTVTVEILESSQGTLDWRALSITSLTQPLSQQVLKKPLLKLRHSISNIEKDGIVSESQQNVNEEDHDVVIARNLRFPPINLGNCMQLGVHIKNMRGETITLNRVYFVSGSSECQFSVRDCSVGGLVNGSPVTLAVQEIVLVRLAFHAKFIGLNKQLCIFDFDKFNITRHVCATVNDPCHANLGIHVQYNPSWRDFKRPASENDTMIVKGDRPFRCPAFLPVSLPQAPVPLKLWQQLEESESSVLAENKVLREPLNAFNYQQKLTILLHLEEAQMNFQMRQFAMERVSFCRHGEFLSLIVPGLAEKRPSLLIGDSVIASSPGEGASALSYEGCIHQVHSTKALLKFHPSFHDKYQSEDYSVTFKFNRTPLRRCHFAIKFAMQQLGPEILFPKKLKIQLPQVAYVDPAIPTPKIMKQWKRIKVPSSDLNMGVLERTEYESDCEINNIRNVSNKDSDSISKGNNVDSCSISKNDENNYLSKVNCDIVVLNGTKEKSQCRGRKSQTNGGLVLEETQKKILVVKVEEKLNSICESDSGESGMEVCQSRYHFHSNLLQNSNNFDNCDVNNVLPDSSVNVFEQKELPSNTVILCDKDRLSGNNSKSICFINKQQPVKEIKSVQEFLQPVNQKETVNFQNNNDCDISSAIESECWSTSNALTSNVDLKPLNSPPRITVDDKPQSSSPRVAVVTRLFGVASPPGSHSSGSHNNSLNASSNDLSMSSQNSLSSLSEDEYKFCSENQKLFMKKTEKSLLKTDRNPREFNFDNAEDEKFSHKDCENFNNSNFGREIDNVNNDLLKSNQNELSSNTKLATTTRMFIPRSVELRGHKKNILGQENDSVVQQQQNKNLLEKNEIEKFHSQKKEMKVEKKQEVIYLNESEKFVTKRNLHCTPEIVNSINMNENKEETRQERNDSNSKGYCVPVIPLPNFMTSKTSDSRKDSKNLVLKWFNKSLNSEQQVCVRRILEGSTRPLPYVIYGPPGTGKTVTLVEAILQIFNLVQHSRILVVTPSNSASDLIAERLISSDQLSKDIFVRLNAYQRVEESIPGKLLEFCSTADGLGAKIRCRVMVATASTAGQLYSFRLHNGHFTHLLIDEAGQMTEPEACVAMGLVNNVSGQIVLAGDPKQLGPVVQSSIAKKYGLQHSLLHRLCSSVLYQPNTADEMDEISANDNITWMYEPRLVTLLVKNYRSHPDLLTVPSQLFYNNSLKAQADQKNYLSYLLWSELPNASFPLLFHGVVSDNLQEGDSPSWFNPAEAFQSVRYVSSLITFGLKPEDIGVITPYRKQCEKIRKLLSTFNISETVKVGSVEEFQGQERTAIIISTVRSSTQLLEIDLLHSLGFVRCERRFNVAVTRAKALLIVVGNPFLLSNDPCWRQLLSYALDHGAYRGPELDLELCQDS